MLFHEAGNNFADFGEILKKGFFDRVSVEEYESPS
jgi:hypothetical protein